MIDKFEMFLLHDIIIFIYSRQETSDRKTNTGISVAFLF